MKHYRFPADPAEMNGIDIICLSLSRSDAVISSPGLCLAREFAKKNRVFYIDHPFSWKDYFSAALKAQIRWRKPALLFGRKPYANPSSFPANLTIVTTLLTLPINFLPKGHLYKWLSAINDRIVKRSIRGILRDYEVRDWANAHFLPNGADTHLFNRVVAGPLPKPTDIQSIRTPIIGFTGSIDSEPISNY